MALGVGLLLDVVEGGQAAPAGPSARRFLPDLASEASSGGAAAAAGPSFRRFFLPNFGSALTTPAFFRLAGAGADDAATAAAAAPSFWNGTDEGVTGNVGREAATCSVKKKSTKARWSATLRFYAVIDIALQLQSILHCNSNRYCIATAIGTQERDCAICNKHNPCGGHAIHTLWTKHASKRMYTSNYVGWGEQHGAEDISVHLVLLSFDS
jgi:hypothetical protein